ncbi:LOW QUALITY PROTEIN: transcriptional regulator, IclR family [Vibrio sp. JCM 19052]|nr:LOW QUALITY PROTEIN: transcriptional regulator, IclR family [Vibrio sp. JCM 19052]
MSKEPKRIQSVERSFTILEALSLHNAPMSLQQVSEAVGLNKTTVHGLLATMSELGYVSRVKQATHWDCDFVISPSHLSKRMNRFVGTLLLLKKMAQLTDNTAYLAVQSGAQEYLYLDAIERDNPLTIRSPRGKREGLTTSAIGKVFLAFNEELRRRLRLQDQLSPSLEKELNVVAGNGYALDLEEAEPNLNCLAIRLYLEGELVAVAGVSGHAKELNQQRLIHFASVFLKR